MIYNIYCPTHGYIWEWSGRKYRGIDNINWTQDVSDIIKHDSTGYFTTLEAAKLALREYFEHAPRALARACIVQREKHNEIPTPVEWPEMAAIQADKNHELDVWDFVDICELNDICQLTGENKILESELTDFMKSVEKGDVLVKFPFKPKEIILKMFSHNLNPFKNNKILEQMKLSCKDLVGRDEQKYMANTYLHFGVVKPEHQLMFRLSCDTDMETILY